MISADIPAQLPVKLDLDQCFKEAAAELRDDERQALLRVAAGTATRADAERLASALGHTNLFHHVEPDVEPRADEDEPE